MSTTYAPRAHLRRRHVNRWLVAVIGLAAALVALGTWVLVDRYAGGSTAVEDATALIDDMNAATTAGDADAVAAMFSEDAVFWTLGDEVVGRDNIRAMTASGALQGFEVDRVAPVTVEGDVAMTFVHAAVPGEERTLLIAWQTEGAKIARFWAFGLGETTPFDEMPAP